MRIFFWILEIISIASTLTALTAAVVLWKRAQDAEVDVDNASRGPLVAVAVAIVSFIVALLLGWYLLTPKAAPIPPVVTVSPPVQTGSFYLERATPVGVSNLANAHLRLFFSQTLSESTVADFSRLARVTNSNATIDGAWKRQPSNASPLVEWMEFIPTTPCQTDVKVHCFPNNATLTLTLVGENIRNRANVPLSCATEHPCTRTIVTGSTLDATPPVISWVSPQDKQKVSANDQVNVLVEVEDAGGVSHAVLLVDGVPVARGVSENAPGRSTLTILWSTVGKRVGDTSELQVMAYDADGNTSTTSAIRVEFEPPKALSCTYAWTFTPKPGLPPGSACQYNYECSSRFCVGGICVEGAPVITQINPDNGIAAKYANTYITIAGRNFGGIQQGSIVKFNDVPAALGCSRWSNSEIIAQAPPTLPIGQYSVTVTTSAGVSNGKTFTVNTTVRPALCLIDPNFGATGDVVTLRGDNLGDTRGDSSVTFVGISTPKYGVWSNTSGEVTVPERSRTGQVVATVVGNASNPITFTMSPFIERLSPSLAPEDGWMTIIGGNFGTVRGSVLFEGKEKDSSDDVLATFPEECGSNVWNDRWVIVKVPKGAKSGLVRLTTAPTTPAGALTTTPERSQGFTLTQDPVGPGLCQLIPPYGVAGDASVARGVRLGEARDARGVTLGLTDTTTTSWTPQSIRWRVPAGAESDDVVVHTNIRYNIREECRWITFRGVCPWGLKTAFDQQVVASNGLPFTVLTDRTVQCTVDADCPFGQCIGGFCRGVDNGGECRADIDCRDGLICDPLTHQCRPPGCETDADCREGQICNPLLNICVERCDDTSDCPSGFQCVNGSCRPPVCDDDSDCQNGQTCDPLTNMCVGGYCDNDRKDFDETSIDCGGSQCPSCGGGGGGAQCDNGVQDADETGVDCGGAACAACNSVDCPLSQPILIGDQCVAERCGDEIVQTARGEECDDGNTSDGDGCSGSCHLENPQLCGNNTINSGEQCDDGNRVAGDGCSATCQREDDGGLSRIPYPPELTATDGSVVVTVSWTANDNGPRATGYRLYRSRQPIDDRPASLPTVSCGSDTATANDAFCLLNGNIRNSQEEWLDNAVKQNTLYHYRILAFNAIGDSSLSGPASGKVCATCNETPGVPRNVTAVGSNNKIALSWVAPLSSGSSTINTYKIYRKEGNAGALAFLRDSTDRTIEDSDVTNGSLYCYAVSARNEQGEGMASEERCAMATSGPLAPGVPRSLAVDGLDRRVALTWLAPTSIGTSAITLYKVYRRVSNTGNLEFLKDITTVSNLRLEDTGLTNGTVYCYAVSARNAQGEGEATDEECATPAVTGDAPGVPRALTAEGLNERVALSWQAPTSQGTSAIDEYRVYRRVGNFGAFQFVQESNALSIEDGGLINGTLYCYIVSAHNSQGEGEATSEECATPLLITPFAPELAATDGVTNTVITWAAHPEGPRPTGFRLYRSRSVIPDEPTLPLPTVSCGTTVATSSDAFCLAKGNLASNQVEYRDEAVKQDIEYHYRLLAFNNSGFSPLSYPASAKACSTCAEQGTEPFAPDLAASGEQNAIALQWSISDAGPRPTGFRLYRSRSVIPDEPTLPLPTVSCGTTVATSSDAFCLATNSFSATDRDYNDRAIKTDTEYHYRILAFNGVGDSALSNNAFASPVVGPSLPTIDHVRIIVEPGGEGAATSDRFACGGGSCADDRGGDDGVQHRWRAEACTAGGDCTIDASFEWSIVAVSPSTGRIQLSNRDRQSTNLGDALFATPVENGTVNVSVIGRNASGSATASMRVSIALPVVRSLEIIDPSTGNAFPGKQDFFTPNTEEEHEYRVRAYDQASIPTTVADRDAHAVETGVAWSIWFGGKGFTIVGASNEDRVRVNGVTTASNPFEFITVYPQGRPGYTSPSPAGQVIDWVEFVLRSDQTSSLPDLTITRFVHFSCNEVDRATVGACGSFGTRYAEVTIKNQGTAPVVRDFVVSAYWNQKLLWLGAFPSGAVKRVEPGASFTVQVALPFEIDLTKSNQFRLVLDALDAETEVISGWEMGVDAIRRNTLYRDNVIQESNEENNSVQIIVGRELPDLGFAATDAFTRFKDDVTNQWKLKFKITNLGEGAVTKDFISSLSMNGSYSSSQVVPSGQPSGALRDPLTGEDIIDPGETLDVIFVDPIQTIDQYRVITFELDPSWSNSIEESNETNNTLTIGIGGNIERIDIIRPTAVGTIRERRAAHQSSPEEELPQLNPASDTFLCAGRDTCADDIDPSNVSTDPIEQYLDVMAGLRQRNGVQHNYLVQAYADAQGTKPLGFAKIRVEVIGHERGSEEILTLNDTRSVGDEQYLNFFPASRAYYKKVNTNNTTQWESIPDSVAKTSAPGHLFVTANPKAGAVTLRLTAVGDGSTTALGSFIQRSLEVEVYPCENIWPNVPSAFPFVDTRAYVNNNKQLFQGALNDGKSLLSKYVKSLRYVPPLPTQLEQWNESDGQFQAFSLSYCRDGDPDGEITNDSYACVGDRCVDDEDPATAGNQHRFAVQVLDTGGNTIKEGLTYEWSSSDAVNIASVTAGVRLPDQATVTSIGNGTATITVRLTQAPSTVPVVKTFPVTVNWTRGPSGFRAPIVPHGAQVRVAQNPDPATPGAIKSIRFVSLPKLLPNLDLESLQLPLKTDATSQRLKQFILREPGAADVIAVTVMKDNEQYSAARWYLDSRAITNPRADRASRVVTDCHRRNLYDTTLPAGDDCVEGIQEGDTWYLTMARLKEDPAPANKQLVFTNTYLLSITQNARREMQAIATQLFNRWKFALNIDDIPTRVALKRDVIRASDLRDIESRLNGVAATTGSFPALTAGTFVRGLSYSMWPSWQETLRTIMSGPELKVDPINRFLGCDRPHDPQTCWDEANKNFQCPAAGSRAYLYSANPLQLPTGSNAYLGTVFEVWPSTRPGFKRDEYSDPFGLKTPLPPRNGVSAFGDKSIGANGCSARFLRLQKP